MYSTDREGGIEVVLYERSELPPPASERADTVHERLESLVEAGHIDTVTRKEWVKRAPIADCADGLRDTYLSFTSWADRRGVQLTPFFQTRECFSPADGERTDYLVLPAICLAVYDGEGVSAVYPHTDDTGTYTVDEGVQALLEDQHGDATAEVLAAD